MDRTIIVDTASSLRQSLEKNQDKASNVDNEIEQAYYDRCVELTTEYIEALEGDGLRESDVRDDLASAKEELQDFTEQTPESSVPAATKGTAKFVLTRYFGDTPDTIELGRVLESSLYDDGSVSLSGFRGKAFFEFQNEKDARIAADVILESVGLEETAARVGKR